MFIDFLEIKVAIIISLLDILCRKMTTFDDFN